VFSWYRSLRLIALLVARSTEARTLLSHFTLSYGLYLLVAVRRRSSHPRNPPSSRQVGSSTNALEKKLQENHKLVHAVAVRANMRSILVAMMKSFSCSPWIFLVCREPVTLPQPNLIFG